MAPRFRKIGIYYHPHHAGAKALAEELCASLDAKGLTVWRSSAWEPVSSTEQLPGTDLLIGIGGDGTVLRSARAAVPHDIPILGVDQGRLAFLTEVAPDELRARLPDLLAGRYRLEERAMLDIRFDGFAAAPPPAPCSALNDVVLGRAALGRPVSISVKVNGGVLGVILADAIVVATATGSTGYSLSAGGPILDPRSRSLVVTPVAPHLAAAVPLVLPPDSVVDLGSEADGGIAVSIDGQDQQPVEAGARVTIRRSAHVARLVRFGETPFFTQLARRLVWLDERRLRAARAGEPPAGGMGDTDGEREDRC